MAVIGEMLQLKIGEKTYTLPAGGGGTITKVQTSAGAHTTVNVSSGAVSFNVPTKTSHLTNDSGFITNAGVTSITTTAGAHTAISGSTGAVSFNVPTKTSHLTNDSGFLTSHQTLYEANLNWGGKDFSASYGPVDAAMIDVLGANRFAFLKAAGLTIEYSTNGGSSYTDYGATDAQKVGLFSSGQSFYLGKHSTAGSCTTNDRLRVTINTGAAGIYTVLNKIAIYMSTQGSTVQVLIERALESTPTTFTTHKDWTGISGWSGWNILNISGLTTYGNTAGSQYGRIRFTFRATAVNTTYSAALITKIQGFGGQGWTTPSNMAASGHLYSYDSSQNATFPAKVTASGGFSGALTGNVTGNVTGDVTGNVSGTAANVTGTVAIANGGTGQTTAANAINALLNGLPVWTADPTDTTYFVRQDTGGSASYGKVAFSTIWNYISGKLPSWSKASTKPSYTASEVGAAASDHTHTLSISQTGSSPTTLSANTTYTLTAGGKTLVFKTPADSDTHNTAYLYAGASNGTANAATTNGNTYLILMDGGSATTRRKISGSTNVSVASDASGNITITGPDLSGYALSSAIPTETTVSGWGFTKNAGTLTGVTFAGTAMTVSSGTASITQANARTALGLATVATSGSYNDLTNKPTIPTDTNYYHTTGSWSGLTYTATANGGAGALAFTIPTGTSSSTVAVGNHTHDYSGTYAAKSHTHSEYVPMSSSSVDVKSDAFRIQNNQSSSTSQAGSNPYVTTLMLGDSREATFDEYGDGYLAIHGKNGIFLHPQAYPISVYSTSSTYSVGTIVWHDRAYYICTTAITTAEAWTSSHWSNISASGGNVKVHGDVLPTVTGTYCLGNSSLKWNNIYASTINGYTLGAACAKEVVTSIDTSANLPTSNAVKTFVEGKGYITSYTDEKVKLTSNTGSTAVPLVLGPTSITSGTAYNCLYNANLKYTPSTGNLQTTQLNGVTVGSSPKFSDTVTTVTASGTGNVVTGMTASNGAITYTMGTVSTTAAQIIRW